MQMAVFIVAPLLLVFFRLDVFLLILLASRDLLLLPNGSSALLLIEAYLLSDRRARGCCNRSLVFKWIL